MTGGQWRHAWGAMTRGEKGGFVCTFFFSFDGFGGGGFFFSEEGSGFFSTFGTAFFRAPVW